MSLTMLRGMPRRAGLPSQDCRPRFAHRFQTLLSAVAGASGPRRLLALAVVLALLAAALQVPGAQAQTLPEPLPPIRPVPPLPGPEDPLNLSAWAVLDGVELRWLPSAEDAASVDGYEILRRGPGEPELTTLVSDTGTAATTYTDTTARRTGALYRYRVKAIRGGVRSDWSNIAMVLVPPSTPPLVSNTGQPDASPAWISEQYAQGFRLGKHGQGYEISAVSIELARVPSRLTVSLWIGSHPEHGGAAGHWQRKVFDFANPTSFKVGLNRFTAPAGAFAYPNIEYAIVLSDGSSVRINETISNLEDAGGEMAAIIDDSARERANSSTGPWGGNPRDKALRMAVEGSKRDHGMLASTFAQPWGTQEIVSVGDGCCYQLRVGPADRYLIRGVAAIGDNAHNTERAAFFGIPFDVRADSDDSETLFSLQYATARGNPLEHEHLALTGYAGLSEWRAQGGTVPGNSTYVFDMYIESIPFDVDGSTRGGVTFTRMYGSGYPAWASMRRALTTRRRRRA